MLMISLRLPADLKKLVQENATKQGLTMSGYVIQALESYVCQPQKPAKAPDVPEGVSEQTWFDFKRLRAAKKAPVTQRALEGIAREAMIAGYTLEAALRECCTRGWTGFKAEWVAKKQPHEIALLADSTQYLEMK